MTDLAAVAAPGQPLPGNRAAGSGRHTLYELAPSAVLRTPLLPAARARLAREADAALQDPVVLRALAIGCPDLLGATLADRTKGRDLERDEPAWPAT